MDRRKWVVVKGGRYGRLNTSLRIGAPLGRKERHVMAGGPQRELQWPHFFKKKGNSLVVRRLGLQLPLWGAWV